MLKRQLIAIFLLMSVTTAFAAHYPDALGNIYRPWSVMGYYGVMTRNTFGQIVSFDAQFEDEKIYALELDYQLAPENGVRKFFKPLFSTVELALDLAYRNDPVGPIYEAIPMFVVRFTHFPWNRYVATTLGFAEGISYVSDIPRHEIDDQDEARHMLNYLMLELTFAHPKMSHFQLVVRLHHRSGVFGLYGAGNNGSTAFGGGVRYYF